MWLSHIYTPKKKLSSKPVSSFFPPSLSSRTPPPALLLLPRPPSTTPSDTFHTWESSSARRSQPGNQEAHRRLLTPSMTSSPRPTRPSTHSSLNSPISSPCVPCKWSPRISLLLRLPVPSRSSLSCSMRPKRYVH